MKTHAKKCAYANRPTFEGYVECDCDGYHTFNELYAHRITLYIALAKSFTKGPVWRSKVHSDGSEMEGWFVLGINVLWGNQITYHLPLSEWDNTEFAQTLNQAPAFDGHTSDDILKRLQGLP